MSFCQFCWFSAVGSNICIKIMVYMFWGLSKWIANDISTNISNDSLRFEWISISHICSDPSWVRMSDLWWKSTISRVVYFLNRVSSLRGSNSRDSNLGQLFTTGKLYWLKTTQFERNRHIVLISVFKVKCNYFWLELY